MQKRDRPRLPQSKKQPVPVPPPAPPPLAFDCPWRGHTIDPDFVIRNSKAPVAMVRCMKCECLISVMLPPEPEEPRIVPATVIH
jgi:hypothetical protein